MPAYEYQAIDAGGRRKKGVVAADSLREARRLLQAMALYPEDIALSRKTPGKQAFSFNRDRASISARDLVMITRQMATMISTGTPVAETLAALAHQNERKSIRNVLTRLRSQVVEGKRLSEAMATEDASFDRLYRAMVAAGEMSGDLGAVLDRVADYGEKTEEVRARIQVALIYPAVLSVVALSVLMLLMIFVVPKVVSQFDSFDAQLPALTVAVMAVSDFLVSYGIFLPGFLLLCGLGGRILLRREEVRRAWHGFLLRIPMFGRLIRSVSSARFARTLGVLVEGGSPVLDAVRAARETVNNACLKQGVDQACGEVREGSSLSQALKKAAVFSPLMVHMCAAGEKSGSLAPLMIKVADYLEHEFDRFTQTALGLLEPAIVIIMGLMVGVIVLSIMMPIMQLNSLVLN